MTALAVDGEDDLFAWGIDRDAAGDPLPGDRRVLPGGRAPAPLRLHPGGSSTPKASPCAPTRPVDPGTPLYAAFGDSLRERSPHPLLPRARPDRGRAPAREGITSSKAVLRADVNPEGKQTEYVFQYLTQAALCEEQGESSAKALLRHDAETEQQTLALEGATPAEEEEHDSASTAPKRKSAARTRSAKRACPKAPA